MADVVVDTECIDPKELFGQGVRAYVLQDYHCSTAALSKALELLVQKYKDDLHDSLAEVYLYYGKSLLGLSRDQNEALGDAVPKNSAEDSEEEEEEEPEDESEESEKNKTEENSTASSLNSSNSKTDTTSPEDKTKEASKGDGESESKRKEENGKIETNNEEAGPSKPGSSSAGDGEPGPSSSKTADDDEPNDEEDATDLQVAWEVLELAKTIFQRLEDKKSLADSLVVLGEISLENENFEAAINDIKEALEIQKGLYGKDSRTLAETLYKLGMAYSTNSQIDEAIDHFNQSLEYLRNRIKSLEGIKMQTQEQKDEIEELKKIMPDIEEKIIDMRIYKEEALKKLTEAFKEPTNPTPEGAGCSKGVTNISHLVKRKRKLDEVDERTSEEAPAKKPTP